MVSCVTSSPFAKHGLFDHPLTATVRSATPDERAPLARGRFCFFETSFRGRVKRGPAIHNHGAGGKIRRAGIMDSGQLRGFRNIEGKRPGIAPGPSAFQ